MLHKYSEPMIKRFSFFIASSGHGRHPATSVLRLSTLAFVLLAVGGCSKSPTELTDAKQDARSHHALKVGVSFQELDNPYFAVMKQALDEATRSIGAELYIADARHDVTKQINDIEDLVQKGIDILLINPTD